MSKLSRRPSGSLKVTHAVAIGGLSLLVFGPMLLVVLGIFGVARWFGVRRILKRWQRAAERLGLRARTWNHFVDYGVEASDAQVSVRVSSHLLVSPFSKDRMRVAVAGRGLPKRVRAVPAAPNEALHGLSTGDPYFDGRIVVSGDASEALAHFSSRARHALVRVAERYEAGVDAGTLSCRARGTERSERGLHIILIELLQAARDLSLDGRRRESALALNAASDPVPAVRLNNLRALLHEAPRAPEARQAAQRGCADPDPAVRVEAASFLGPEGVAPLVAAVGDPSVDSALRRQALERLGRLEDPMAIGQGVAAALGGHDELLICAAAAMAAERRLTGLVPALEQAALHGAPLGAAAAIEALGQLGDARVQPMLLNLLSRRDPRLRMAAIRALGAVGGPVAVEPLSRLADGLLVPRDVKQAVAQAVEAIRSRQMRPGAGRLSIAPAGEAGRLSWASSGDLELSD